METKIIEIKTLTPAEGKALKNTTTNTYAMSVTGVNVDDWVECSIEEYEAYKVERKKIQEKELINQ